jgi:hypothetical protein
MLKRYFNELSTAGLTTGFFTETFQRRSKWMIVSGYIVQLILLLPLYVFGIITNYIPYILPSKLYEISKLDPSYKAPLQLVAGLITFPLFYILNGWLFVKYTAAERTDLFWFVPAMALSGYAAMYYYTEARRLKRVLRYLMLNKSRRMAIHQLKNDLNSKIEEAAAKLGV